MYVHMCTKVKFLFFSDKHFIFSLMKYVHLKKNHGLSTYARIQRMISLSARILQWNLTEMRGEKIDEKKRGREREGTGGRWGEEGETEGERNVQERVLIRPSGGLKPVFVYHARRIPFKCRPSGSPPLE